MLASRTILPWLRNHRYLASAAVPDEKFALDILASLAKPVVGADTRTLDKFSLHTDQLLAAGVHLGHEARKWHPEMAGYIFGTRDGIHVIDLAKTVPALRRALFFLRRVLADGGEIVLVGTRPDLRRLNRTLADLMSPPPLHVSKKWACGTFTNMYRMKPMEGGSLPRAPINPDDPDCLMIPSALLMIDPGYDRLAAREANKMRIPIVGVVDTITDPSRVAYPIPGSNSSRTAVKFFFEAFRRALSRPLPKLPGDSA